MPIYTNLLLLSAVSVAITYYLYFSNILRVIMLRKLIHILGLLEVNMLKYISFIMKRMRRHWKYLTTNVSDKLIFWRAFKCSEQSQYGEEMIDISTGVTSQEFWRQRILSISLFGKKERSRWNLRLWRDIKINHFETLPCTLDGNKFDWSDRSSFVWIELLKAWKIGPFKRHHLIE